MPKRSSKTPPDDPNTAAFHVLKRITGEPEKDPLAVELGRRGGLKGGKARAKALSAARRSEIATQAAKARWKKKR